MAALSALALPAAADTPPACIPDSNGDGQPLFGWLQNQLMPPAYTQNQFGAACEADLDGDGDLDLAAAARLHRSTDPGGVSILLNDGDGVMKSTAGVPGLGEPRDIVAADFDGDGDKDLAVADSEGNKVWVLLNNGNATFQAAVGYTVGVRPRSIAFGDFEDDGDLDLVTLNAIALQPTSQNGTATVLFNLGGGVFGNRADWTLGARTSETDDFHLLLATPLAGKNIVIADFDEDGDKDFAAACYLGSKVAVRWNSGDGTFGVAGALVLLDVGSFPSSIAAQDVNGDDHLDLVVTDSGSNELSILHGTGTAAFGGDTRLQLASGPVGPEQPWSTCFADFDGDGTNDLVVGYRFGRYMSMLKGVEGSFDSEKAYWAPYGQHAVVGADFNVDLKLDLAVFSHLDSIVEILLNTGDSRILPIEMTTGTIGAEDEGPWNRVRPDVFTVGDWDGDGDLDIAATDFDECTVVMNEGGGNFSIVGVHATGQFQANPTTILNADLDHDGDRDLVVLNDGNLGFEGGMGESIGALLNDGTGMFAPYVEYSLVSGVPPGGHPWPREIALTDIDGDGHVDVVATIGNGSSGGTFGYIAVRRGAGDGTFGPNEFTAIARGANRLTVADFDGDGDVDIATTHQDQGAVQPGVTILHNNGTGTFAVAQLINHDVDFENFQITPGDLNGDGRPDLLVAQYPFFPNCGGQIPGCPSLRVLINTGAGLFTDGQRFQMPVSNAVWGASSLSLADMDNDGSLDAIAYLGTNGEPVGVCMGNGDGTFDYTHAATYGHGDGGGSCAPPVDFDGDGDLDLIVANRGQFNFTILRNRLCEEPPCPADFNNSGTVTIQDLFSYLAAWFQQLPSADMNNSGTVTPQDLFTFLAHWFAHC